MLPSRITSQSAVISAASFLALRLSAEQYNRFLTCIGTRPNPRSRGYRITVSCGTRPAEGVMIKIPGALGGRAGKGTGVGELAAKVKGAQKAEDLAQRCAGAAQSLRQLQPAVFSQHPLSPKAIAIRRREHEHAVHGRTASMNFPASSAFRTSPRVSQPRRAMATPKCRLPRLAVE